MSLFLFSLIGLDSGNSSSDKVLAWDLHSVLFDVNWFAWAINLSIYALLFGAFFWVGYRFFGIRGILFSLMPCVFIGLDFCTRVVLFSLQNGHRPIIEHVWDADPFLRLLKPEFVRFENLYVPNEGVFEIVKELKLRGYSLFLASNIAPDTLRCLQNTYPDYFALFDGSVSPTEANGWCDKKQPKKFFDLVKHKAGNKKIVFIDDSRTNCKNAEKNGFKAICFKGDIKGLKTAIFDKIA